MDKHSIFDHFMYTFRLVGSLSKANITTGQDACIITGYPSVLFNVVLFDTKNQERIGKLKSANIPFICLPSKKLEAEFETFTDEQALLKADFVSASIFNNLENLEYKPCEKFQIRKAINTDDLLAFDRISSIAWEHPETLAFNFLKPSLENPDIHFFLAYAKEQPVGCGILSIANNQAGLYWGSVHPDFRKQGIGTALAEYRMNTAKNLGYMSIIAHNLTPSLNLYKRLGFEQVGGLPLYMWDTEHYQRDVDVRSCLVL